MKTRFVRSYGSVPWRVLCVFLAFQLSIGGALGQVAGQVQAEAPSIQTLFDESEKQNKGFLPSSPPENAGELLTTLTLSVPDIFEQSFLEEARDQLLGDALILGQKEQVQEEALNLFGQWSYLQVFLAYRLEYLMVNYLRALSIQPQMSQARAISLFNQVFPPELFEPYVALKERRATSLLYLQEKWNEREEAIDFLVGTLESAYFTLFALDQKKKYLKDRYHTSDEVYSKEKEAIDQWENLTKGSMAILRTSAFKNEVSEFFEEEIRSAFKIQERALNQFRSEFQAFSQAQGTLSDLADFLSGDEFATLGSELAKALNLKSQRGFRARIRRALPDAVREIQENIEETVFQHQEEVARFPIAKLLSGSSLRPKGDYRKFHQWLATVFEQQPLHWVISEQLPYLQGALEQLTDLVNRELRRQSAARTKRYSLMTLALAASPLGRSTNSFSGWLGRNATRVLKVFFLGSEIYLTTGMIRDAISEYHHWKSLRRLSRTSVDGSGLASFLQEQAAFTSMLVHFGVAGFSLGMTALTARGYFLKRVNSADPKKYSGWIREVARAQWKGSPIRFGDYRREMRALFKELYRSIRQFQLGGTGRLFGALAQDAAGVLTQLMVMPAAALPNVVKGILGKVPTQVFQGLVFGTVMGIMGVTVQHYINAMGLGFFVNAFEKLGWDIPVYWQMNSLNQTFKSKRDAYLLASGEVSFFLAEVAKMRGMITSWTNEIEKGGLNESQKADLEAAIDGSEQAIQSFLRLMIARWYQRPEYRDIYNSVYKMSGIGLIATPSMEQPLRITLLLRMGSKLLTYQTTARQLDELKNRKVIPDFQLSIAEIEALVDATGAEEGEDQ